MPRPCSDCWLRSGAGVRPSGWQAVDLVREGRTHGEVSAALGITRQAVGQRLQAAQWSVEEATIPTLGRLLARAEQVASR